MGHGASATAGGSIEARLKSYDRFECRSIVWGCDETQQFCATASASATSVLAVLDAHPSTLLIDNRS